MARAIKNRFLPTNLQLVYIEMFGFFNYRNALRLPQDNGQSGINISLVKKNQSRGKNA